MTREESLSAPAPRPAVSYRRGVLLVLAAGVCWSAMGLGIRLMEEANAWQILFYRSLALAPFLFGVIALRSGGRPLKALKATGLAGILGAMGLFSAFFGGIYAIQSTTVANAMFLFAAAPFLAALLGRLVLGEAVRRGTWIAMAVAALGIVLMVAEGAALGTVLGNAAALLAAAGFAVFTVALRWGKLEDMMPTVFFAGILGAFFAGLICLLGDSGLDVPLHDILLAFAMGVFQLGAGLTVYTIGSKAVPAVELALLSMVEVVLGPLWVWIFLGETAAFYTLLGGAVLMAALAGNALSGLRRAPPPRL